jgi:alcohol dehydrogenase class IV
LVGLSNHEAADKIIGSIVQIGNDVGLPQCLRDVGATEDELEAVAEGATQPHLLANNPCFVDRRVLLEIVHASYDSRASH